MILFGFIAVYIRIKGQIQKALPSFVNSFLLKLITEHCNSEHSIQYSVILIYTLLHKYSQ